MAPPYMPAKSRVMARRLPDLSSTFIYHLCYPHYCYPVISPALATILLSLLYLFASKSGKICTHNSIYSFLITSSSAVCSAFNNSPFTIIARVKRIIFNYFNFFLKRLTSERVKHIGSLFMLVFVYSKVSAKHFLHVFKNRGRTSLPLLLNPDLLICSTKVRFLVHCTIFTRLCNFPNTLPNCWVEHRYIPLLKKELVKMKKNFSNCYLKRQLS